MTGILRHGFMLAEQAPFPAAAATAYSEAALAASAAPMPGVRALRDIAWGGASWQRYDLFVPAEATAGRPVLVFLHGGGWVAGYKEWCGFMAPAVIASGGILVAPAYRLAPAHRYPVFLEDAAAALAAIAATIGRHGGDPARMVVAGHSAGGHIAAMLALHPRYAKTPVCGALPVSGIMDLRCPDPAPGSLEAMAYRDVLAEANDDTDASPLHWASRARIPFALFWGADDNARVRRTSGAMWDRLGPRGIHRRHVMPGQDHFATHMALRDPAHPFYSEFAAMTGQTPPLA